MKRIRLLGLLILFSVLLLGTTMAQNDCLRDWRYVTGITVQNILFGNLIDWQVKVTLNTQSLIASGKLNPDGSDLRFTRNDCCTELPYWIQSGINTSATVIWVRVPQVAPNGQTRLKVYYGNPAASTPISDIDLVHFSIGNDSMGTDSARPGVTITTQKYIFPINSTTVRWRFYSGDTMRLKFKVDNDTNMVTGTSPFFTVPAQPGYYSFDWEGGVSAGGHPGWYVQTGGNFMNNCAPAAPCPGSCGDLIYNVGDQGVFGALDSASCGAYPSLRVWYRKRAFVDPTATINAEFDRQQPFASFSPGGNAMCFSDTLPLYVNTNGAVNYQWFLDGNMIVGATDTSYMATFAGQYYCAATYADACQSLNSDTITITYFAPWANIGPDTLVCTDNGYTLDAGPGYSSYLWDDGSTAQTRMITASGTYSVTISDSAGCPASDTASLILRANPNPVITPAGPHILCPGASVELSTVSTSWYAYEWLPNGETSGNIDVSNPGAYSVIVWDSAFCFDTSAVVLVTNFSQPTIELGGPYAFCQGDSVILNAGPNWMSYAWPDGSSGQSLTVHSTGNYIAIVSDSNGCIAADSALVTVSPNPTVDLGPSDSICANTIVTLNAGAGWSNVAWMNGATTNTLAATAPGAYYVTVTDVNGCKATSPILYLMAIPQGASPVIVQNGDQLQSTVAASYQWYFNSMPIAGANGQNYVPTETGNYYVVIPDPSGCTGPPLTSNVIPISFFFAITADQIPQGFSPNGDGINDVFEIQNLDQYPNNSLVVLNRWGTEVFRQKPYLNGFNGYSDEGKELPIGTYFYILDLGNDQDIFKGYLIIQH